MKEVNTEEKLVDILDRKGSKISRSAISKIEANQQIITDYQLIELSQAFQCSPLYLLGLTDKKEI